MTDKDPNALVDYNVETRNIPTVEPGQQETDFIPYRGHNQHGVAFRDAKPMIPPDITTDLPLIQPIVPVFIEPIPVKIVETIAGRNVRLMISTSTYPLVNPGQGGMIVGQRRNRDRLRITNAGPANVYVGTDSNVNQLTGFIVQANTTFEIKTTEDVYAILDPVGVSAMLYIFEEFTIEIEAGVHNAKSSSHNRLN